eukprot:236996-Prymnesium_polylepis.1
MARTKAQWPTTAFLSSVRSSSLRVPVVPLFGLFSETMPALQLPDDSERDEYDTDCTWAELAAKQSAGSFGVIDRATVEEGDCIAMMDRNLFSQELIRRVFVLLFADFVLVFDEHGQRINEPQHG